MLLTKEELAETLRVSTRTIDRWRSGGLELGEVKIGGVVRFDDEKVLAIIQNGKAKKRKK